MLKLKYMAALLIAVSSGSSRAQTAIIYSYTVPMDGYAANGNVTHYTDSVTGTWNMQYDGLNRLKIANVPAADPSYYHGLNLQWDYDSFGNRRNQAPSGSYVVAVPGATSAGYSDGSNRITSSSFGVDLSSYDDAGNLKFDGLNHVAYDAENRVCAVQNSAGSVTQYLYNADGQRVAKGYSASGSTLICPDPSDFVVTEKYVLGQSGEQVTQLDGLDHWQHTNVYADGQLLATYDQEGTQQPLHFNIADPLGTKRVQAAASGAVELTCVNLPFGDFPSQNCTGPGQEATKHFFTGKERDTESGLDYFGARYYASSMGRFMSPDWADKPEAVPYSDLTNPQSLNLYGYVNNNPLGKADPDGHCCEAEIEEGLKWASETSAGQAVGNTIGAAGIALGAFVSTHASEIIDANMSVGGVSSSPYYGPGINNMGSTLMRSGAQSGTPNPQPSSQPGGTANPGPDGPYKRPNNTTTQAQRDSVQGKPCATCGATGQKNNADHKDPLVEQHYRGGIDKDKMRSPGAVQPQCQSCSNQQGGYLRTFSQAMKRLFGFN